MNLGVDIRCLQDKKRTGVGEYAWQILNHLAGKENINISAFANAAGQIDFPDNLARAIKVKRGYVPNKLMNLLLWLKLSQPFDRIIGNSQSKLDVLWLPNPSFVNLSNNVPVLLTVHDLSFLHYPYFFPVKGKFWYFPAVKNLLTRGLPDKSLIAAVSQHTANDLIQVFPHLKNKVRVMPPGLDHKHFIEPSIAELNSVRVKYKLPEKFLLSLGTIEPRKNYMLLLQMYEKIIKNQPNFPCDLVIAGGWGWRYNSIKKFYDQSKAKSRIRFIGYVDDLDKTALYNLAEIFIYPSVYEGIGLPVLEAMAAGTPVIASQSSSLPEVVEDGGILLSPYLIDSWAEVTNWLISNNNAKADLRARGLAQANKFSWTNTAEAYNNLFIELAEVS